jgi:hypothetical protein
MTKLMSALAYWEEGARLAGLSEALRLGEERHRARGEG